MLALRSQIFNVLFYANLIAWMIFLSPIYFLTPRKKAFWVPKAWARSNHWLMKVIVGMTFEIEGLENLPKTGCIYAPKHQSFWDTYALLPWMDDPVFILKRELTWIPLFGWYVKKQRMIPVDRGGRGKVMLEVMRRTKVEMDNGRQLIIYPEGTRRPPGDQPHYRYGIARIYRDMQVPVVPIAMQPGLFWPRRSTMRYPGHFKVRILPAIEAGKNPDEFFEELIAVLEKASDEVLLEDVKRNPHLPLPPTAAKRVAELKQQEATG